jgi:hypothetical protein
MNNYKLVKYIGVINSNKHRGYLFYTIYLKEYNQYKVLDESRDNYLLKMNSNSEGIWFPKEWFLINNRESSRYKYNLR